MTSVRFASGRGNLLLTNSKDSTLKVGTSFISGNERMLGRDGVLWGVQRLRMMKRLLLSPCPVPSVACGVFYSSLFLFASLCAIPLISMYTRAFVQVVDARMYQVVASLRHPSFRTASSFSRASLSPSAAYAAAASANGNVYVWDIAASSSSSSSGAGSSPSSSSSAVATVLQTHGVAATGCDWCLNMPSTLASCDSKGGLRVWG